MVNVWMAKLDKQGRIVIPSDLRKRLGLKEDTSFLLSVRDGEIVLTSAESNAKLDAGNEKDESQAVEDSDHGSELRNFLSSTS